MNSNEINKLNNKIQELQQRIETLENIVLSKHKEPKITFNGGVQKIVLDRLKEP
jgi:prefoldin subunit 5